MHLLAMKYHSLHTGSLFNMQETFSTTLNMVKILTQVSETTVDIDAFISKSVKVNSLRNDGEYSVSYLTYVTQSVKLDAVTARAIELAERAVKNDLDADCYDDIGDVKYHLVIEQLKEWGLDIKNYVDSSVMIKCTEEQLQQVCRSILAQQLAD